MLRNTVLSMWNKKSLKVLNLTETVLDYFKPLVKYTSIH